MRSPAPMVPESRPLTFAEVLGEELAVLSAARAAEAGALPVAGTSAHIDPNARALDAGLSGLALSGGGIRSATFNLGVLQALAEHGVLPRIDYLSTVSGGGYIGAWCSAWLHRAGRATVFGALAACARRTATPVESAAIEHLRRFSNYLTPKVGALSADFWTGVATHVRNTFLNQAILLPLLVLLLAVPWALALGGRDAGATGYLPWAAWSGFSLLLVPAVVCGLNFVATDPPRARVWEREPGIAAALFTMLPASYLLALWLPGARVRLDLGPWSVDGGAAAWAVWGAALYLGIVAVCGLAMQLRRLVRKHATASERGYLGALFAWSSFAGAGGGCMLYGLHALGEATGVAREPWLLTGFGTVAVLIALSLTVALHIGFMSRRFPEAIREWLGRAGAWLFIAGGVWIGLYLVAFVTPAILLGIPVWLSGAGGLAWITSTAAGVLLGRSDATGVPGQKSTREVMARVAPYVFMAGLLGLVATALYLMLLQPLDHPDVGAVLRGPASIAGRLDTEARVLAQIDPGALALVAIGSLILVGLLGLRVDVNLFSFHGFYRNRIARCYLGASNRGRREQPFTGFDPADDLRLDQIGARESVPLRPLHVLNAALNLTRANNLAWQERRAAAFAMTALHCGYDLSARGSDASYLRTIDHRGGRGLHLATAVAISGAAASPNMGYHSSLPVAFLMALFNVRLGWWMPNTRAPAAWRKPEPGFSVRYILKELFAAADESADFVYLSDGGHFDNMGLYELVRRRCRFIVVCDAEADADYRFEGIANAVRKCRVDFNVDIDVDIDRIRPVAGGRECRAHAVLGTIRYDTDPGHDGHLLYLKASLVAGEDLPADVRHYALAHAEFPHESTADQWFGEAQFESYRALGHAIATRALVEGPRHESDAQARRQAGELWERWLGIRLATT